MAYRRFTREFKLSAVRLINEQGYTITKAAQSLGVDRACIREWVEKFSSEPGLAPVGDGVVAAELRKLRAENARLLIEREILKKAAQFFAREQL